MIKKVSTILIVLLILFCLSGTAFTVHSIAEDFIEVVDYTVDKVKGIGLSESFKIIFDMKPATYLIYGIDSGDWPGDTYREGQGRADTIVLLKVYPEKEKASLLSIPRDTLVEIPGRSGQDKFGHAYAYGGAPLLLETAEQLSGLEIDYYIGLNYAAFKDVIDHLGGVEFEVDRVIEGRGLRLEPGLQVLDGDHAFALVSFRKESLGDIGRVQRQQRFIMALLNEAKTKPLRSLLLVFKAFWDNVDTDIELHEVAVQALKYRGIEEEDISMEIVPGSFYNYESRSYWKPDIAQTEEIIRAYFGDE